jgi:hypothetical protein
VAVRRTLVKFETALLLSTQVVVLSVVHMQPGELRGSLRGWKGTCDLSHATQHLVRRVLNASLIFQQQPPQTSQHAVNSVRPDRVILAHRSRCWAHVPEFEINILRVR